MVTDMEWKCCHGYTGDECSEGPSGGSGTQIGTARPRTKPSRPGQTGTGTGHGGQNGGDGGWKSVCPAPPLYLPLLLLPTAVLLYVPMSLLKWYT